MFNKYYRDELAYLVETGKVFSRSNPDLAPFLGGKGNDPDVERILEGFAFLTAQIRQKLEDEFPEFTHSLINLLFPHYLRPIPSMSILAFEFDPYKIRKGKIIESGAEVESVPKDGVRCKFRTCYDTVINPVNIEDVETDSQSESKLRISFKACDSLQKLDIKKLRFYLHGEAQWELYLLLFNYVQKISVTPGTNRENTGFSLPPSAIKHVGFHKDEAALKHYPENSFEGYRLIQEYFSFPNKFLFFEITELDAINNFIDAETFEIVISFSRKLRYKVSTDNLLLNCTPVANVFSHSADPINLDYRKVEYMVSPSGENRSGYEVYSIDSVKGVVQGENIKKEYYPFASFIHEIKGRKDKSGYYNLRIKPSVTSRGANHFISFVTPGDSALPSQEIVSLDITCTNRDLPTQIKVDEITNPTSTSPQGMKFSNITKPTSPISPAFADNDELFFNLISHLSLNYKTVANKENLREILRVYNLSAFSDNQKSHAHKLRIDGIVEVESEQKMRLFKGVPVRGVATEIKLKEENFEYNEGEMYLFASILNEFLGEYLAINTFSELVVSGTEYGERYTWPPRMGQQTTI